MPTIIWASRRASTCFFMNAPAPTLTSRTSASRPDASFFDMMVRAGVVRRDIDYRQAYTLRFVNKRVGLDLRPKN